MTTRTTLGGVVYLSFSLSLLVIQEVLNHLRGTGIKVVANVDDVNLLIMENLHQTISSLMELALIWSNGNGLGVNLAKIDFAYLHAETGSMSFIFSTRWDDY